jgi:hypothetical protein
LGQTDAHCSDEARSVRSLGTETPEAAPSSFGARQDPHEVRWSGVDALDRPAPDGSYTLYVEVTESDKDGPGALETFDVVKGPAPTSVELPVLADGALVQASLAWTPE